LLPIFAALTSLILLVQETSSHSVQSVLRGQKGSGLLLTLHPCEPVIICGLMVSIPFV